MFFVIEIDDSHGTHRVVSNEPFTRCEPKPGRMIRLIGASQTLDLAMEMAEGTDSGCRS
jgi:hypothetical protein